MAVVHSGHYEGEEKQAAESGKERGVGDGDAVDVNR